MDKKIKPYRRLPSKPPGPKFQCCTKLYIASSALGFDFFVHRPQTRSPKGNIEIWGCRGDDNTAGVWFHRPSTVVLQLQSIITIQNWRLINYIYIYGITSSEKKNGREKWRRISWLFSAQALGVPVKCSSLGLWGNECLRPTWCTRKFRIM